MAWILYIHHKDGYVSRDRYERKAEMILDWRLALADEEVVRVEWKEVD